MHRSRDLMTPDGELTGHRILVTGGTRGIGLAVSRHLADRGASLVLAGRDPATLDDVAQHLGGGPHSVVALDVTDEDRWDAATQQVAPDGLLHGIVTAAGEIGPIGPLGSWSADDFRRTLEVNVLGTLLPIMVMLEPLRAAKGAVVTFSGGGATTAFPRFDAYTASKVSVVRLTENLAEELAADGVRVNAVAPGFVMTEIHAGTLRAGPDLAGSDYFERTRKTLEERTGDSPERAASLVAFLLSPEADGITGRVISAQWDPWEDESFCERLRNDGDLATLRRIDDHFFQTAPQRVGNS
jgi:NAD(P)-dependent dehydrogenase (short-subunit alcohol dehydrogenase family)